jgi:haloalkane dehalogenase
VSITSASAKFHRILRSAPGPSEPTKRKFHQRFRTSELFLVPGARHYVQIDEPEEVARLILSTPTGSSDRPL